MQQPNERASGAIGPSFERIERTSGLFWRSNITIKYKAKFSRLIYLCSLLAGQEIRDRFSGAVEAFARRNASGSAHHGEASKHKISGDALASSKEAVSASFSMYGNRMLRRWNVYILCSFIATLTQFHSACNLVWFRENPSNFSPREHIKAGHLVKQQTKFYWT